MLQAPSNQYLSWRFVIFFCYLYNSLMVKSLTSSQRAVGLKLNVINFAKLQELPLVQEGMEFNLVNCGYNVFRVVEDLLEIRNCIVTNSDSPGLTFLQNTDHSLPCLHTSPLDWPMD